MFYRIHKQEDLKAGLYWSDTSVHMNELKGCHKIPRNDSKLVKEYNALYEKSPKTVGSNLGACGFYGFVSLEQMRAWIYKDEWLEALDREGFVISSFDIEILLSGNSQAIAINFPGNIPIKTVKCSDYELLA